MSKEDIDLFFHLMGKLQSYHLTTKEKSLMTAALILVPGRLQFNFMDTCPCSVFINSNWNFQSLIYICVNSHQICSGVFSL